MSICSLSLRSTRGSILPVREDKNPTMRWSVFSSSRVRRGAEAFYIARCDVNADVQIADVACDQGLVVDFATAQDAIHVVADQIHHPVAHAHIELDIRVACMESR